MPPPQAAKAAIRVGAGVWSQFVSSSNGNIIQSAPRGFAEFIGPIKLT